ncbi:MAG: riboflavin biosynthesis protein RibF [Bacteroidetes bacterium]|nr:riboflavin biosynthesis protein RibF [Bacteroidota bacterium]
MKIFRNLDEIKGIKNAVVTTGSFDGVHVGHKVIINRLRKLAKMSDGESVLITFHPHPRRVLYPDSEGKDLLLINSQREKIELLRKAGLDNLVIINFTKEFAQTTSMQFVKDILLDRIHAKKIIVGFNHFFGHNKEGNYNSLHDLAGTNGFEVEEIPEQDIQNETVSSTKIRKALLDGDIQRANAYLDHQYIMVGELTHGSEMCKKIGLPTMSIFIDEDIKLVPPEGVYAVSIIAKDFYFRGMLNIRNAKTIYQPHHPNTCIDLHLFDYNTNLIGNTTTVFFHKRIRDLANFNSMDDMKNQLTKDKAIIDDLIF